MTHIYRKLHTTKIEVDSDKLKVRLDKNYRNDVYPDSLFIYVFKYSLKMHNLCSDALTSIEN
jgi:hypothetical protein